MGRLTDKNILITGGNSGIGLATAQEFDREGARVAICGLNERTLQAAKGTLGAGSLAVRADVSKLADLDTMFATIKREFGHLGGLFVNAGYSEFLPFEEVTEQSFDMVIGSNFKGAYFTIQKALPLLRPGSSVVINASVGARKGWPTTSTVSTCKAAVVHLARILSAELIGRGIRVNTLSPGPTDTAMFGRFAGEEQGDAVKGVLAANNPSKRMADPSEIAKLAVYLASDDSAYVVGARGGVAGVYQRHDWAAEKRAALDAWEADVLAIVENQPPNAKRGEADAGGVTTFSARPAIGATLSKGLAARAWELGAGPRIRTSNVVALGSSGAS
jgi:NAD(P)-dependent dehydrogenase (short-subunit alcohol dehydrogenase family)